MPRQARTTPQSPKPTKVAAKKTPPAHSPTPAKVQAKADTISFYEALRYIMSDGGRVTKLEWNNPAIYMAMNGEYLSIMKEDGVFSQLILRDVDIAGEDWVVLDSMR